MPRIKKRGLEYFPIDIDFIHNRVVRRLMKREGDAALTVLVQILSYIYSGEGYYVKGNWTFYEDLADNMFEKEADDVERIVSLALEYEYFDSSLYKQYGILTSADIQRQFLFSTAKRRTVKLIDPLFNLISDEEAEDVAQITVQEKPENAHYVPENADYVPQSAEKAQSGTHSIAQNSRAKQSKAQRSTEQQSEANPLLNSSPKGVTGAEDADMKSAEESASSTQSVVGPAPVPTQQVPVPPQQASVPTQQAPVPSQQASVSPQPARSPAQPASVPSQPAPIPPQPARSPARTAANRRTWTKEDIDRLQPPPDGMQRNLNGLILNLRILNIPPAEQYAIICKSNYGVIGHPMWKGFSDIRDSHGKIRQPGHYLLSLCRPSAPARNI